MPYPTLEQYNQAFSAHSKLLADPELRAGKLATTGIGMPLAISGGFALTYTVTAPRGKFAVRCFHRESKGLERRYAAISKKLASLRSPYFLDFQFQPQGIRVDGAPYPVVKMAWASGTPLFAFLDDNLRNPSALGKLADALIQLAAFMQREGVAHGDLSTENLMVSRDGSSVQLIDYDGMFVDEIKSLGSAELGNLNFQHPQRKALNPFDATLDRFSLISLSLSIRALQADASLWDKTSSDETGIVFRFNDFHDPASSPAFSLVAKNPSLATHAKNFAAVCKSPMALAPDLADFLAGRNIPQIQVVISPPRPGSITVAGRPGYIGAYPVLLATDYAACLRVVGDKVEVIGRIVEVKQDKARNGKPYIFVNFGPWQGSIFKVSIWSDGLALLKSRPDDSWIGKWVSVVGLMEPPFVNKKFRYSHLSITVGASGALSQITEQEARYRLAGAGKAAGAFSAGKPSSQSSNQQTLDKIRGVSGAAPSPSSPAAAQPVSPNAQVLQKIRAASGAPPSAPPSSASGRYTYQPPPQQPGVVERLFKWLFG
ncbi:serine/threonine protein kinase [Caenimonas sedimenti]|uniref:Serine/threonine protein kinase n=1 Tax=Caenimonas sedimenti TaxID=2596921 RepID=A0A562ZLD9_9BURK|nr:serine/threonine protein kinase [Caenimonas sedimenti]TWO69128.1 serine/threonine protein kinase [Caenimonas sedimenti]